MNINRGNNRRRGRGNRQQGGGGQQLNRIDSRARGNAPQLLEKYRKLAQDAHLNGDRVTAEYYLQFADHYFRVIADTRLRQEEGRNRRDDRWQEGGDEGEDAGEFSVDNDFPTFDQPPQFNGNRRDREDRPREERPREDRPREDRPREERPREERPRRQDRTERFEAESAEAAQPEAAAEEDERSIYEPPQNPFVRADRPTRGLKPRREDRRPRREDRDEEAPAALDPSMLPPAIGNPRDGADAEEPAAPAKPRRGRPRTKPPADDALESVG